MNIPRVFKPRKSLGWLWLAGLGLIMLGFTVLPLLTTPREGPLFGILLPLLLGVVIGGGALLLAALFPTMRYELHEDALVMIYGPWKFRVPYQSIRKVSWQDLSVSLWSSFRLPGFALFTVPYNDVGNVQMCATSASKRILLIKTDAGQFGLTPREEQPFIDALMARVRS